MTSGIAAAAQVAWLLASEATLLLGEDFLPWMVLAFGAAMVVGNVLALLRPPGGDPGAGPGDGGSAAGGRSAVGRPAGGRPEVDPVASRRPSTGRAAAMIGIGLVAALWGAASLVT